MKFFDPPHRSAITYQFFHKSVLTSKKPSPNPDVHAPPAPREQPLPLTQQPSQMLANQLQALLNTNNNSDLPPGFLESYYQKQQQVAAAVVLAQAQQQAAAAHTQVQLQNALMGANHMHMGAQAAPRRPQGTGLLTHMGNGPVVPQMTMPKAPANTMDMAGDRSVAALISNALQRAINFHLFSDFLLKIS